MLTDKIIDNIRWIVTAVLFVLCIVLSLSTSCSNQKNKMYENNITAYKDTLHEVRLKNGELLVYQQSFVDESKRLNEYINMSDKKYKEVQKKLDAAIQQIALLEGGVHVDTIRCVDSIYVDKMTGEITSNFTFSDEWLNLSGTTKTFGNSKSNTTINGIDMNMDLTVGIDKTNKFFVTTDCPYVSFTSIKSATTVEKKKRFNVGVSVGLGLQYGLIHRQLDFGPYIGGSFSYGFDF